MLLSTTPILKEKEVLGLVCAETALGIDFMKDFFAGYRSFFGGQSSGHTESLKKIRTQLIAQITEDAVKMGADAIEGINITSSTMPVKEDALMLMIVSGTAIKIKIGKVAMPSPTEEKVSKSISADAEQKPPVPPCGGGGRPTDPWN